MAYRNPIDAFAGVNQWGHRSDPVASSWGAQSFPGPTGSVGIPPGLVAGTEYDSQAPNSRIEGWRMGRAGGDPSFRVTSTGMGEAPGPVTLPSGFRFDATKKSRGMGSQPVGRGMGSDPMRSGNFITSLISEPVLATGEAAATFTNALNKPQQIKAQGQADAQRIQAQAQADAAAAEKARQDAAVRESLRFSLDQLRASVDGLLAANGLVQDLAAQVAQLRALSPGMDGRFDDQAAAVAMESDASTKRMQRIAAGSVDATQAQVDALAGQADNLASAARSAALGLRRLLAQAREAAYAALRSGSVAQGAAGGLPSGFQFQATIGGPS